MVELGTFQFERAFVQLGQRACERQTNASSLFFAVPLGAVEWFENAVAVVVADWRAVVGKLDVK
ncbi:hypothetical protein D3C86_2214200 [compost metagenome]